uniref:C4 protein n=1 Tax=Potato yellow mosaic virus TaxID=10827 RepID=G0LXU3_9GEMI|nr:C4 protein [Potato yellow mosaic virus]
MLHLPPKLCKLLRRNNHNTFSFSITIWLQMRPKYLPELRNHGFLRFNSPRSLTCLSRCKSGPMNILAVVPLRGRKDLLV